MEKISIDCFPTLRLEYMVEDYHELVDDNEADQPEIQWCLESEEDYEPDYDAVLIAS